MAEIAIRLDPATLTNPDLDLRYRLPDAIVARAGGQMVGDGYDYDEVDRLIVFLEAADIGVALPIVLKVLAEVELVGNRLLAVAVVAVSDESHCADLARYRIVHPPGASGTLASK